MALWRDMKKTSILDTDRQYLKCGILHSDQGLECKCRLSFTELGLRMKHTDGGNEVQGGVQGGEEEVPFR